MSILTTSRAISSAISSQESGGGAMAYALQDGPTTDLFGREVAPVSHTPSLALLMAERRGKAIVGISGLYGGPSSRSIALQLSLENRLGTPSSGDGGTKYAATLKRSYTPVRRWLSQLVPCRPIMKERGYIGLPTPVARDGKDISRGTVYLSQRNRHSPSLAIRLLGQGAPWTAITAIYALVMGYPLEWNAAQPTVMAMPSSRKSQQK